MNEIKSSDWTAILQSVARVMTDNADHLCEMDARMGDGDLGLTMKKGYCALPELYAGLEEADMGKRLSKSGIKMSSVVPSTMGTLMASGLIISRHVFAFLPIRGAKSFGRILNLLSAYWGFVFMSLHLSFHWGMFVNKAQNAVNPKQPSKRHTILWGSLSRLVAVYGVYAFIKHDIGAYLTLKNQFVFLILISRYY